MRIVCADIWSFVGTHLIVIPTNIGYVYNSHPPPGSRYRHRNVMGRGLAEQARDRNWMEDLAGWYGDECKKMGAETPVMLCPFAPLIMFPTKPFIEPAPGQRSSGPAWKQRSSIPLIKRSIDELARLKVTLPVALPLVGTGNGKLPIEDVLPMLVSGLTDDRFLLVVEKPGAPPADGF